MQIHLQLSADGLRLPIAYQYMIQGMIYHALDASPVDQRSRCGWVKKKNPAVFPRTDLR